MPELGADTGNSPPPRACRAAPKPLAIYQGFDVAVRRHASEVHMADEAVVAQKGPYQVELAEGKPYFYCRCGRSQKQPFCDGTHNGTGIEPLRFVVDHAGTFNICGCKHTDDEPFCDGSHLIL
jgi:CDGSH-type Zn-finger protein